MLQKIRLSHVRVGMILGNDIFGKDAVNLVSRGKVLDEKTLKLLLKHFKPSTEITIYIPDDDSTMLSPFSLPHEKHEEKKLTLQTSPFRKNKEISLSQMQDYIAKVFSPKEDYQITKELLEKVQKGVKEAFDFLITHNEIEDKKFIQIAHQVIRYFELEKQIINPAYLYLIELEKWHHNTLNHSIDVAFYTLFMVSHFSNHLGELNSVFLGGLLHDIGKYLYNAEGEGQFYKIITKNGPLTSEEFELLKKHVDVQPFFEDKFRFMTLKERDNILFAALDHHEKLDGSGYLKGKKGMHISLIGRIVAIADIYDAMIRQRDYKSMVRPDVAMKYISSLAEAGKLDKQYTQIFRSILGVYPTGSVLSTSHGQALVIGQTEKPERPKVMLVDNNEMGEVNLAHFPEIDIYEEV